MFLITCSLAPPRIIKLVNFNSGSSNVFEYKDLLFLKHIGISIRLVEKKEVIVDWRKNKNVEKICGLCISSSCVKTLDGRNVLFTRFVVYITC